MKDIPKGMWVVLALELCVLFYVGLTKGGLTIIELAVGLVASVVFPHIFLLVGIAAVLVIGWIIITLFD